jgi:propionate CoA-transferase
LEKEVGTLEALSMAQAVYNSGGKVIVQVEKVVKAGTLDARLVKVPGIYVDTIVEVADMKNQMMTFSEAFNPSYVGNVKVPVSSVAPLELDERKVISRRAAMELHEGAVVNIGFGLPQMISGEAMNLGIDTGSLVMTSETGVIGGVQLPSVFSVSMNADAVYDQASQFRFYEGGGLDIGFLGALEVDAEGNVNVCKKGQILAGVGGFNFIVHSAKKLVFCFPFMRGSGYKSEDGKLVSYNGKDNKIVKTVESISMNAGVEFENNKTVLYITERCVFRLNKDGIELIEIAPGLDPKKDVLDLLDFIPSVAKDLKEMPKICFEVE